MADGPDNRVAGLDARLDADFKTIVGPFPPDTTIRPGETLSWVTTYDLDDGHLVGIRVSDVRVIPPEPRHYG